MDKYKNLIIIGLFILFMGSLGVIYYLVTKQNEELLTIKGEVIVSSDDYVIIEGINEDYVINNLKGKYKVGDVVEFSYTKKDLDSKASPKTIKVRDEELIETKAEGNNSTDNNIDNSTTNNDSKAENNKESSENLKEENNQTNTGSSNSSKELNNTESSNSSSNKADTEVLQYFNDYQTKINSNNLGSSVKSGFVSVVDFLFYNGTIKGHTFSELTDSAKLKVLAMALYFDGKIETYFPGYKESISNTASKVYTNIKEKIVSTYLNITTRVCTNNSDACANAKEGFAELKKNFSLTWELIKDIAGDGITNLKNWYEIWRSS